MTQLWIPGDRFLAVVDRNGPPHVGKQSVVGRRLSELRSGRQEYISLDTADRILCSLGLSDWWHMAKADGGLADIYEEGRQYGSPYDNCVPPPPAPRKYHTPEERLAGSRRRWRESKQRRKERLAA